MRCRFDKGSESGSGEGICPRMHDPKMHNSDDENTLKRLKSVKCKSGDECRFHKEGRCYFGHDNNP